MKKLALAFGFVFMTLLSVNAQTNVDENPNAPVITFTKLVHDYGTIVKEADGKCSFEFKNTGKEPLIVSKASASCGCTIPKWSREPILPGKTGVIEVSYDTKRLGTINKQITVSSNAKNATVVLTIKGQVMDKPGESAPLKPNVGNVPVAH